MTKFMKKPKWRPSQKQMFDRICASFRALINYLISIPNAPIEKEMNIINNFCHLSEFSFSYGASLIIISCHAILCASLL